MNTPQTPAAGTPALRILRIKDVVARTTLSQSEVYLRAREGTFPRQISLGGNRVGWIEAEVEQWITDRIAASRPPQAA